MWNFKRSLGDMTGADSTEATLLRVRDYGESNYKKMSEQLRLFEEIKHDKMTEEQIIASVKSFHQQEREKMIPETLKGMAALLVFQFVNVYMVWNRVSAAIGPLQLSIHVVQSGRAGEQKSHLDKTNKENYHFKLCMSLVCLVPARLLLSSVTVLYHGNG